MFSARKVRLSLPLIIRAFMTSFPVMDTLASRTQSASGGLRRLSLR